MKDDKPPRAGRSGRLTTTTSQDHSSRHQRTTLGKRLDPCSHCLPLNIPKKRINVFGSGCTVVHLVGMLVHVHDQDWKGGGRSMRVIGHPVVLQLPRVRVEAQ